MSRAADIRALLDARPAPPRSASAPTLFDAADSHAERAAATDESWCLLALDVLRILAVTQPFLNAGHLWGELRARNIREPKGARSKIGAVFMRAARALLIEDSGEWDDPDPDGDGHRKQKRWRSRVYRDQHGTVARGPA